MEIEIAKFCNLNAQIFTMKPISVKTPTWKIEEFEKFSNFGPSQFQYKRYFSVKIYTFYKGDPFSIF